MARKSLLLTGIIAMFWYAVINIIVAMQYPGYDVTTQTVSELSAIDSPTRNLWVLLCTFYSLLFIVFGIGVLLTSNGNKKLQVVAAVIMLDGLIGFYWPPMHQREVLAAGGGSISDTLHIAWTFIHLVLMLLMIGFGAAVFGKSFKIFSIFIVLIFIVFGILTANESPGLDAGLPTPYIGIWERINIGAYMLWIVVFTIMLFKREKMYIATNAM